MLVAVHGDVLVDVSLGRPVDDLPLAVFCQQRVYNKMQNSRQEDQLHDLYVQVKS